MSNELIFRYLYYLTYMSCGTDNWKEDYDAWCKFSGIISYEEHEKIRKKLVEFNKKYGSSK